MADLSDVETAIVGLLTDALYPGGLASSSRVGAVCRIYRGWPLPASLNSDLSNNIVNVTVFPSAVPDEVLSPYLDESVAVSAVCTMDASVSHETVTFTGIASVGQTAGVLIDGSTYTYKVIEGDTTQIVAANFAVMLQINRPALLTGASVVIPAARRLEARVFSDAMLIYERRRQRKQVKVSCWCPSPSLRDKVGGCIDLSVSAHRTILLADGTHSYIQYLSTEVFDQSQSSFLFRRDLNYTVQYSLCRSELAPIMIFGQLRNDGVTLSV